MAKGICNLTAADAMEAKYDFEFDINKFIAKNVVDDIIHWLGFSRNGPPYRGAITRIRLSRGWA